MHRTVGRALLGVWCLVFAGTVSVAPAAAAASGSRAVEYRADQVVETEEGTLEQKVFAAPGKQRTETEGSILIARFDKGVQWVLLPDEMMYMEQRLDPAAAGTDGWEQETTLVGPDTVGGLPTNKFKTIARRKGSQDKFGGFSWETADGIVVKMDLLAVEKGKKERFKIELTNLVVGPQPPELFEVPPGYQKMALTGFVPGALGRDEDPEENSPSPAPEKGGVGGTLKEVGKGLKGLLKW